MTIQFLKARNGDCIHIRLPHDEGYKNILIDGGPERAYEFKNSKGKREAGDLKRTIEAIRDSGEKINLLILTHVDDDHVGGLLKWFSKDADAFHLVEKVWFNSAKLINRSFEETVVAENLLTLDVNPGKNTNTSIVQGVKFEDYISQHGIWEEKLIKAGDVIELFAATFTILSPDKEKLQALRTKWEIETSSTDTKAGEPNYEVTLKELLANDRFKEDTAIHNGSSISFILSYRNLDYLFLSDAHPTLIIQSLTALGYSKENPLQAALVKISHHGSKANMNVELFDLIQADDFIISTNGDQHNHPDKQLLARLIGQHHNATIYFNYPQLIPQVFTEQDFTDFPGFRSLSCEKYIFAYDH